MPINQRINQISAILLAAGGSIRLGRSKQLLPYKNELLINFIIQQIIDSGILDLKIILGCNYSEIKKAISFRNVEIIKNNCWEKGISSSIKCGLERTSKDTKAVIFFVVDQPFLEPQIIKNVLRRYISSNSKIIATEVNGQLTHPVLFRQELFTQLFKLTGDSGGKSIFSGEYVETVQWDDPRLLLDIDQKEDYEKLISIEN